MSEYSKFDIQTGEWTHVYELEKCLKAIRVRDKDNEEKIKSLLIENKKLKDEYNKDEEIQKMKLEVEKMRKNYWRGFPITEEENIAIRKWCDRHDEKVHGWTDRMRMHAEGCCGGRYKYIFLPTSIGISGKIVCHCGSEFEFKKIT